MHGLGSNWSKYKSCVHYLDTVFGFSKDNIKQKDKNGQQTTVWLIVSLTEINTTKLLKSFEPNHITNK